MYTCVECNQKVMRLNSEIMSHIINDHPEELKELLLELFSVEMIDDIFPSFMKELQGED